MPWKKWIRLPRRSEIRWRRFLQANFYRTGYTSILPHEGQTSVLSVPEQVSTSFQSTSSSLPCQLHCLHFKIVGSMAQNYFWPTNKNTGYFAPESRFTSKQVWCSIFVNPAFLNISVSFSGSNPKWTFTSGP